MADDHVKRKILLLGDGAVGKTSLIRRFVHDVYDDYYLSTVGTKVSKKSLWIVLPATRATIEVDMTIWDIMGEPEFRGALQQAYFAGAQGVLAVCDLTRQRTLDGIYSWVETIDVVAERPSLLVVANKSDLPEKAQFGEPEIRALAASLGCGYLLASAKTGLNVQIAFQALTRSIFADIRRFGQAPGAG